MGLMLLNESLELVQGKQNIKKGNSHIRRALFMPAFVAVKHNEKPAVFIIEPLKNMALK
jgi:hypothetical protein